MREKRLWNAEFLGAFLIVPSLIDVFDEVRWSFLFGEQLR